MRKKMLVTGGAGFIGSNFVHAALASGAADHLVILDALTYAGHLANLGDALADERVTFVQGDIRDHDLVARLFAEHELDAVVHFAAESHVDRSIRGPAAFVETNIMGTFVLLEAARRAWLDGRRTDARFHHVSTDEVFGSLAPGVPAFTERTPYSPNSPYAASKAASDHLVRAYGTTYGLPFTISNCSNNYGPRQFPEKLIPLTIVNAVSGKKLPIYGDGQQVRDWLHVEDHCEAILTVLETGVTGETYNIGGENQPTNLEIVNEICEILDDRLRESPHRPHRKLIEFVQDRPGHDRRYAMNIEHVREALGWRPRHDLATGLAQTVDWYLANAVWLAEIATRRDYQEWIKDQYRGGTEET